VKPPLPAFGSDAAEAFEGQTGVMHSAGSGNIASGQQSDHLLMAAAYNGWLAAKLKVCPLPACCSCSHYMCMFVALTGFTSYIMSNFFDLFCAAVALSLTREESLQCACSCQLCKCQTVQALFFLHRIKICMDTFPFWR